MSKIEAYKLGMEVGFFGSHAIANPERIAEVSPEVMSDFEQGKRDGEDSYIMALEDHHHAKDEAKHL
jgi:hypothetical protein